jgi:hypothetical protein
VSALSQTEFCQQENLAYSWFRYWLKKYRLRDALSPQTYTVSIASAPELPAGFIPQRVVPAGPTAPSSTCVIEYQPGIVVRLDGQIDATMLVFGISLHFFLCAHATDIRKSSDGLSGLVTSALSRDRAQGEVYVFLTGDQLLVRRYCLMG